MAQNDIRIKVDTDNLQKKLEEAKIRFKSLSDVEEKSSQKALIGNQHIVNVVKRRKKLLQEIADMEKAGIGLGYKKYDGAQQELSKLNQEVKDYENNAGKTQKSYEQLKNVAQKCAKAAGTVVAAIVEEMKKGIQEGFSNLLNYSKPFQSGLKGLKASALTLKNAFAAMFAPFLDIAVIAMSYIQKLADYMTQLFDMIGQFIAIVWGQKTYTKAVKQTNNALKEGKKAGEGYLSPLDKINQLQSSNQDASGSTDMFEEVPVDSNLQEYFDEISEYVQKLKDSFAQGFEDGLGDWGHGWQSIKDRIRSISDNLIEIWHSPEVRSAAEEWGQSVSYLFGSIAGSMTSIGLTIGSNLIGGIEKYLSQNKENIKKYLVSMFSIWEEINTLFADLFQSIAYIFEAFADENGQQLTANIIGIGSYIFMGVAESASKFFRDIAGMIIQPFVDNQEAFRTALDDFLGILAEVTGTIKNGIEEIFADFNVMYDEHFKPFFDSVTEGLSNLVGKFFEFWNDNVQPVLQEWSAEFDTLWKESLQPFFSKLIEMFGNVADIFKAVWENAIMPLLDSIVTNVLPMILSIVDGIVVAVMKGVEVIIDIAAGAIDALNGIIKFLLDVFTGNWESIWNKVVEIFGGIWEAIKKIVNQILALIEGFANGIISGVNTVIRALNMLKLDVPDWVTDLTGIKDFGGFNIPEIGKVSIPRLATGTVVPPNREFLAVLGDNQREPEIVSPVSTMKDAFKEVFAEIGSLGRDDQIVLNVTANVDGRTLFGFTQDYALDYYRRTGRSPYPI